MSEQFAEQCSERGTFICRIDGRAGYLRLWDDRLELIRSGRRGPQVLGAEVIPLHLITQVSTGKPGRLLTALQLVAAGGYLELKMPSPDAPRVAELLALLVSEAPVPAGPPTIFSPEPAAPMYEPAAPMYEPAAPMYEPAAPMYEPVMPDFSMQVEMPQWTPLPAEDVIDELVLAVLERPAVLAVPKVEMPEWTPLPETDQPDTEMPEMVLSQIVLDELRPAPEPAPSAATEPISEIEPLPDGSVLAAAAALAELESMLADIPPVPAGVVVDPAEELLADAREILSPVAWASDESDGASIPAQPSEAVLTLAAAALLGGARSAADASLEAPPELAPEPAPRPERPADLTPDLARRLAGLEVLRNSGIMSEDEFLAAEAEILESVSTR